MEYVVVIEKAADGSLSAYLTDLPGCVACGDTLDEVRRLIREAVEFHLDSMRDHNEPIPQPTTVVDTVRAA